MGIILPLISELSVANTTMKSKQKRKCYHYDTQGNAIPHLIDLRYHKRKIQDDIDALVHANAAETIFPAIDKEKLIVTDEPDYAIQKSSYEFVETLYHTNETKSDHSIITVDPLVSQNNVHALKHACFTPLSEKTQNDNEIYIMDETKDESILLNTPMSVYKCEICSFTTHHENIYTNHVKEMNHRKNCFDSQTFIYQSSKRKRVSKNVKSYRKRIESVQIKSKNFKCERDHCTFASKYRSNYQRHLTMAHNEEKIERINPCKIEQCHFTTKYPENHKLHVKLVHMAKNETKNFNCEYENCKFATHYKRSYNKHLKMVHNLEKIAGMYTCKIEQCRFTTKNPRCYKSHIKFVHMGKNETKKFNCKYENCKFATHYKTSYNTHLKMIHIKESIVRMYTCKIEQCCFTTKYRGNYDRHKKIVHDKNHHTP